MKKTLLFGEPMALLIADEPGPLEKCEHFTRSMSGAEVNVGIGLTRLGHKVEYLTRLGDDPFGHYIYEQLHNQGIGTSMIEYDSVFKTGIQLKELVADGSDPKAPYYRKCSAASHICADDIDKIDLTDVELVHVTGIPPALSQMAIEATVRLMERAKENGIMLTFDPNLRPALWNSVDHMIDVINKLSSVGPYVVYAPFPCSICFLIAVKLSPDTSQAAVPTSTVLPYKSTNIMDFTQLSGSYSLRRILLKSLIF